MTVVVSAAFITFCREPTNCRGCSGVQLPRPGKRKGKEEKKRKGKVRKGKVRKGRVK
jgi:hypothetical protein